MCICWYITGIVIGLLIGLPCIIEGCNDWSCPLYYDLQASVLCSENHPQTCNCCFRSNADGNCFEWGACDCGYYLTGFLHLGGTCGLQTPRSYQVGEVVRLLVNKHSHDCSFPSATDDNIVWVGLAFCLLSGLSLVALVIDLLICWLCCNKNTYYYSDPEHQPLRVDTSYTGNMKTSTSLNPGQLLSGHHSSNINGYSV